MAKKSNEEIKRESGYLRGDLPEQLAAPTDHFDGAGMQLLKFHGIYQQDDRDARKERKKQNLGELYFFMCRSKLPGGKLTPDQYLVHDELGDRFGNGSIRLTSRQGIQLHGVFKHNLRNHLRALNEALVSTLAACGDVERNVMSCPAPIRDNPVRDQMQALADRIAQHLCPRTTSYHEVWLNGEKLKSPPAPAAEVEPIYGTTYLPRKFKTGIALPEDNCIDLLSNDAGLLVSHKDGRILGYNVFVGGGMGMKHGMAKTYPRLASPLCFATPDEVIDVLTAVVKVQRDFGNREDRDQARMKYLIDKWGIDAFRAKVQEYHGKPLAAYNGETVTGFDDHLGWHSQGDGKLWLGIPIESGRIKDTAELPFKTGLRKIVSTFRPNVRITAQQNILLCDLAPAVRDQVNAMLADHQIGHVDRLTPLARYSMACPALPTCHLALSDSERVMPDIVAMIDAELLRLGLAGEDIVLHMTGCPNGCARPYNSDIGIVGRQPGKYTLYLGGNKLGSALSFQYADFVPHADIPNVLRGPLLRFKQDRKSGESFGEFCQRQGAEALHSTTD